MFGTTYQNAVPQMEQILTSRRIAVPGLTGNKNVFFTPNRLLDFLHLLTFKSQANPSSTRPVVMASPP
jgi:hypothetical protein